MNLIQQIRLFDHDEEEPQPQSLAAQPIEQAPVLPDLDEDYDHE